MSLLRLLVASLIALPACVTSAPCPQPLTPRSPQVAIASSAAAQIDLEAARAQIGRVLDDWHDAAAKAYEVRYFAHVDEASIFLGTDENERWTKTAFQAYAHPHFAKGKAWTMKAKRRDVVVDPHGQLAHFDEDLDTKGLGPARGSGVLAILLGQLSLTKAVGSKRVKPKGPVWKVMALADLFYHAQKIYPAVYSARP